MKIFKQETDKSCGVACLRSAMNSFGKDFSEKDVWDKHESYYPQPDNMMNPMLNLGITALKFGFDVKYFNYHPIIANNNKDKDLRQSLEIKSKKNFAFGKYYVDKALEFLDLGGEIIIDKLNVNRIKKIIDENKFVIVEIKPAFVNGKASLNMNHKIIITDYTNKGFKILDPGDAKEHIIDFDTFMLAFYAAVPELIVLRNKQ